MLYQTTNPHGGDVYSRPVELDFSISTNPYGTPQGVLDAVRDALPDIWQYPDPYCGELVDAISRAEGVPKDHILCGNGAAELIYAYCDAVRPQSALELAPTFSEYSLALKRIGCAVERYVLRKELGFALDDAFLKFLEKRRPELVFLCNPNNPTGRLIPTERLEEILSFCTARNIRLFLDECFLELTKNGVSMRTRLDTCPGLFILKAFTKSYGMAGLRLGYGLSADAKLMRRMSEQTQLWNVSLIAQEAGVAALKEQDFLRKTRETIWREREWLTERLTALGLQVCPSEANYLLFSGPEGLREGLMAQGIAIRGCENFQGLSAGWYRVSVRLREENMKLVWALGQTMGKA